MSRAFLHLVPKIMQAKEPLKRIFMGRLIPLSPKITEGMADYEPPIVYKSLHFVSGKMEMVDLLKMR